MSASVLADATFSPGVAAATWADAVRAAGRDLVHARAVGPAYVDEMVQLIDDHGPWCVVAPGIALPHARPSALVRRAGAAIVTLREPVSFGHPHHDPVRVVVALASTTQSDHVRTLAALAVQLDRPGVVDAVAAATVRADAIAAIEGATPGASA
ncbi:MULTISPECIES: PTS sugar transporter subunit IIA [unclassified Agrococcus]|uniref:PTS sugar transporter subunit IIA n=1 Tax=unclassified Agrococcus TaxID=2615065 RepID=UPI0036123BE0